MVLKPQDIVVLLKLAAHPGRGLPYGRLAHELQMSASEVHAGLRRSVASGLAIKAEGSRPIPMIAALEEFLVHGVRYAFPAQLGGMVRGMPTAWGAPPLKDLLAPSADPPPVWADPNSRSRGFAVPPLYATVPEASRGDERLYALLALVDALRIGNARERELATRELQQRLRDEVLQP